MVLFDLYTGTDFSNNTVTAENRGIIDLSAGYNSATDVAVSLVGMGSYIDDEFLNGKNNPAFAEKMKLNNYGDINLSYQGAYKLADTALKMGQGLSLIHIYQRYGARSNLCGGRRVRADERCDAVCWI